MSPLEFGRALAAYDADCRERFEAQIAQAWHGVALYAQMTSTGNLPPLSEILGRIRPQEAPAQPKVAQVAAQVMTLSKWLGTPLRPMSDEAKRAFVRVDAT